MIRRLQITALAIALVSASSAIAWPATDAGPDAAEISANAGAPSSASLPGDELTGSNEELLAQLRELQDDYAELKTKQKSGGSIRLEIAALALGATWVFLGIVRRIRREWTEWGKSWLPWVALGLGVAGGFLERYVAGSGAASALIVGAGPPLAVAFHELTKVWTKRGT